MIVKELPSFLSMAAGRGIIAGNLLISYDWVHVSVATLQ